MCKSAAIVALLSLLSGCASTVGAFFNRPVVEDGIKDVASTISLAADRRTVVVVTEGNNRSRFCAEPPPDTATGLKSELDASIEAKIKEQVDAKVGLKDKFQTDITVIAERTAALDAFRTGVYALCQYHLNGAVSQQDVKPLFETLIAAFGQAHSETTIQRQALRGARNAPAAAKPESSAQISSASEIRTANPDPGNRQFLEDPTRQSDD